jgi:hypothetical protein
MSTKIGVKDYYERTDITRFCGREGTTYQLTQKVKDFPFYYYYVHLTEDDIIDLAKVIDAERNRTIDVEEDL